jgi:hypothetical protein
LLCPQVHVVVYKRDATYTELERKFQAQPPPQPQPQPALTKLHNVRIQHGDITKVKVGACADRSKKRVLFQL